MFGVRLGSEVGRGRCRVVVLCFKYTGGVQGASLLACLLALLCLLACLQGDWKKNAEGEKLSK